ncbi:unnamed protein product, partial [Sphagnum compactum]
ILDPIVFGHYPISLQQALGIIYLASQQRKLLIKGSYDFIGLNLFTSEYATFKSSDSGDDPSKILMTHEYHKTPCNPFHPSIWLFIAPIGMPKILGWIQEHYNNPPLIVTENGEANSDDSLSLSKQLEDYHRIDYHHDYMQNMLLAIKDGSDVRGYFAKV